MASLATHSPKLIMISWDSINGIKSLGYIKPLSGDCQRIKASKPIISPVSKLTLV